MRSYRDLAEDAGVTVEAVRDAMGRAERHEIPYTRMYDDFGNPPRPFGPGRRPCWPRCAGTHDSGNAAGCGGSRSLKS